MQGMTLQHFRNASTYRGDIGKIDRVEFHNEICCRGLA